MASNGDMTRNWFGGVPIIVYDDAVTYLGDMNRNWFGGIPQIIGPVVSVVSANVPAAMHHYKMMRN